MTKKIKQNTLSMLNRHHSQKIDRDQHSTPNSLIPKKSSNLKKSIKKPQQELLLIDKVEMLKEKNHKFYKNAQKKIDRIIDIINQIDQKHLSKPIDANQNHTKIQHQQIKEEEIQSQAIKLEQVQNLGMSIKAQSPPNLSTNQQQKQLINKTINYLHNFLTYQRPLWYIKHEFQSFYSRLSAFAKELKPEEPLSSDKKFLIPQNGLSFDELRCVEQLIKQHYLRMGDFEIAEMFDRYGREAYAEDIYNHVQNDDEGEIVSKVNRNSTKNKQQSNNNNDQFLKFENIMKLQRPNNSGKKSQKKKPKVQLVELQENFKQCFNLRQKLYSARFSEAINWCVQQRLYETHQNPLQYNLRLAEIKLLIFDKNYRIAFQKIQKDMVKFLEDYEEEINMLIGYLLFSCEWNANKIFEEDAEQAFQVSQQQHSMFEQIINSRYNKFLVSTINISELVSTFTHDYFIHYGISHFDTLEICYKVGKMYEKQYFDSIKLFSEKQREQFIKHRGHCELDDKHNGIPHSIILPFEIPVSSGYCYHSIFVCPVTKQVLSSNDGVQYLSCGHLVSQSAKKNMAEVRRSNHKQKCPVCNKDRTSDVVKVMF